MDSLISDILDGTSSQLSRANSFPFTLLLSCQESNGIRRMFDSEPEPEPEPIFQPYEHESNITRKEGTAGEGIQILRQQLFSGQRTIERDGSGSLPI